MPSPRSLSPGTMPRLVLNLQQREAAPFAPGSSPLAVRPRELPTNPLVVTSRPIRLLSDITDGLPLHKQTVSGLQRLAEYILQSPNVLNVREKFILGMKVFKLAYIMPDDNDIVSEILRRILELYRYQLEERGGVAIALRSPDIEKGGRDKTVHIGGNRPPGGGWMVIPGSKHGGYHRRKGTGFEYWYPDQAAHDAHQSVPSSIEGNIQQRINQVRSRNPPPEVPSLPIHALYSGAYTIEGVDHDRVKLQYQTAKTKQGHKAFAIIEQPGGSYVLVSKPLDIEQKTEPKRKLIGEKTQIKLRAPEGKGIESVEARYVLMEADDLIASHNPKRLGSFSINEKYPENVQERRYHAIMPEQEKVDSIARHLDPAIMVNTNPDGVNGTPVMTQDHVVLGGNGRSMGMQLAYREYPESGTRLKNHLIDHAQKFGFSPDDVKNMRKPVMVREVVLHGKDNESNNLRLLGRRLNESLTQGLDPRSEAVAISQFVNHDVVSALVGSIEQEQTLNDYLHSNNSKKFVESLRKAGIIDAYNKSRYLTKDGDRLTEDGRMLVERVLAARFIPDADLLDQMHPTQRECIALSAPSLFVAENAGWDVRESLMLAIKSDLHIREHFSSGKNAVDFFMRSQELAGMGDDLSGQVNKNKLAENLLRVLRDHLGVVKTPKGFREFARLASKDAEDYGEKSSGMLAGFDLGEERLTPEKALDVAFGLSASKSTKQKTLL